MKTHDHVRKAAAFAIVCSLCLSAHAQLGTGWTPDNETYIAQTSAGATITAIPGGYEFRIPTVAGLCRAEMRGNNLPTNTTNQWQGLGTLVSFPSGSNHISMHQVFGDTDPTVPDLILDEAVGGPTGVEIMSLEQSDAFEASIQVGVQFKMNTIYDPIGNLISIYVNGSLTGTKVPNPGPHYNKYGQYVSKSGFGPATFDWVNVQSWSGGTAGGGGGTTTSYTITASAGSNGSISPLGSVRVNKGASQSFSITPNSGYKVSGVTVDGSSVGAVASYTFSNVQANHSISATFVTNTVSANYSTMYLRGTMNNWGTTAMTLASANLWQVTVSLSANTAYQYKYDASGAWTIGQNWGAGSTSGVAAANAANVNYTSAAAGNYVFKFNDSTLQYSVTPLGTPPPPPPSGEGPYGGSPAGIPGTVQAENYDTGGQGVAYNVTSINGTANSYRSDGVDLEATSDTGGGNDLGWASGGQWFKYTVNVATAGTYTVSFRVAAPSAVAGAFHLANSSGANLSGSVSLPSTGGWQSWATVTASVTLPAGQQVLTLNQDNGGWNLNYMSLAASSGSTGGGGTSGGGTSSSTNLFAPYLDMSGNNNLAQISQQSGIKDFTLAFIVGDGGCGASWFGNLPVSQENNFRSLIDSLRSAGGDVIISFGGAAGTELAGTCTSVSNIQSQYQAVIDKYNVRKLDFDIEGAGSTDTAAIDRRNQALAGLQAANSGLVISYTLPVSPGGLIQSGLNLLQNAKSHGVNVAVVNIMAMDYGSGPNPYAMGQNAIDAANATISQLQSIGLNAKVGITPMIGLNDSSPEVFTVSDAQKVVNYAKANSNIGRLSFWCVSRDQSCSGNAAQVSEACSGIVQNPWDFAHAFEPFAGTSNTGGGGTGAYTTVTIPGTLQAENYDTGGQGVGYNVTSINGTANGYRSDGVDLEATSDTGGGNDLGWASGGQWFKYTVNVATAGTYTVSFRVAAPSAVAGAFHLANSSGANLSGSVSLPSTGGWQSWATVTASVTLPAGQQILTLSQDNGGWNLNYMSLAASSGSTGGGGTVTSSGPDFGPNVLVFDPSMSASSIQGQINNIYNQQYGNQFGSARYALLFKPGTYNNTVNVGYYTQVLGLGQSPDNVTISGGVISNAALGNNNATCNFWEGAENMAVIPSGGTDQWAVSQACPMRRMHIKGSIILDQNGGWASGGFLSDSLVDNQINSGTQQQWLSRNCQWGSWAGSNWNMVFVGDTNPPAANFPANTVAGTTPVVREKPFLTIDSNGNYSVFVPALRSNSQGVTWSNGSAPGQSIPISQFYIAKAGTDTAATINAALNQGLNLLLTPGVYSLTGTIQVTRANTVVLGLGFPTLLAQNGVTAMSVADVDGVIIGGILFDAGPTNSPALLQVGPTGNAASHAGNPTSLHDLFFRVGGAGAGKATVSLLINSNNVIGDDLWIWRADHGNGVGWTTNTAANGLVVNGVNVTIYGLAVEHYQQYQTLWNADGGTVYFYQSEAPYDVPNQSSWMAGSENGYASYKVADWVATHHAYGLGVYCYFSTNSSVKLNNAFEVPNSGLNGGMMHDMVTVSLGGVGEITHVLDGWGGTSNGGNNVTYLAY